jgi:hypothetical protein
MRGSAERGSRWATLGLAPLAGPVLPWLGVVRRWATPFFNFAGLAQFKAKLRPASWAPIWMVHPAETSSVRALLDALTAFAGGSLWRFGWRTLVRGPRPVLVAMAALLLPWTLVLATLDVARWYPAPWMQTAWVGFDLALCALLALLALAWRHAVGVMAALLVTLDVLISSARAVVWYVPRVDGPAAALALALAVGAPALAARVLWGRVARSAVLRGQP